MSVTLPISKPLLVFIIYTIGFVALWRIVDLGSIILNFQDMELPIYYAALFSLLYVIRGFFYIPSLYFIIVASLLFPFPVSVISYLGGVAASTCLSYSIGHVVRTKNYFPYFRRFVERKDIQEKIERQGLYGLFLLQVVGFIDIPNYLSGYLRLPFVKFFTIVMIANTLTAGLYFILFAYGIIDVIAWLS